MNPYASPRALEIMPGARHVGPIPRRYPWVSVLLAIGLLLDMLAIGGFMCLIAYAAWYQLQFPGQPIPDPPFAWQMALGFAILAMMLIWPITSLAALVYAVTIDRGTRGWLVMTIVATLLFLIWFSMCLVGIVVS